MGYTKNVRSNSNSIVLILNLPWRSVTQRIRMKDGVSMETDIQASTSCRWVSCQRQQHSVMCQLHREDASFHLSYVSFTPRIGLMAQRQFPSTMTSLFPAASVTHFVRVYIVYQHPASWERLRGVQDIPLWLCPSYIPHCYRYLG